MIKIYIHMDEPNATFSIMSEGHAGSKTCEWVSCITQTAALALIALAEQHPDEITLIENLPKMPKGGD